MTPPRWVFRTDASMFKTVWFVISVLTGDKSAVVELFRQERPVQLAAHRCHSSHSSHSSRSSGSSGSIYSPAPV
jgi:hypothetical protein